MLVSAATQVDSLDTYTKLAIQKYLLVITEDTIVAGKEVVQALCKDHIFVMVSR